MFNKCWVIALNACANDGEREGKNWASVVIHELCKSPSQRHWKALKVKIFNIKKSAWICSKLKNEQENRTYKKISTKQVDHTLANTICRSTRGEEQNWKPPSAPRHKQRKKTKKNERCTANTKWNAGKNWICCRHSQCADKNKNSPDFRLRLLGAVYRAFIWCAYT